MGSPRARQTTVALTEDQRRRVEAIATAGAVRPTEAAVIRAVLDIGLPALERATGVTHTPEAPHRAA